MEADMILQKMRTILLNIERIHRNAGGSQVGARINMSRQLGIGLGTLENLIRVRVKSVDAGTFMKAVHLWLNTIEAEIARLENQRDVARQIRLDIDPAKMDATEALLESARAHLREVVKGGR